jgi:hypothetical protein
MPDRFMARRLLSTEFPAWWLAGRPLAEQSDFLAAETTGCRLFYFGLSCQTFTSQETAPPDGIRPECRALEARFRLVPVVESVAPNAPDGFMRVPNAVLRFGFYRLEPRREPAP